MLCFSKCHGSIEWGSIRNPADEWRISILLPWVSLYLIILDYQISAFNQCLYSIYDMKLIYWNVISLTNTHTHTVWFNHFCFAFIISSIKKKVRRWIKFFFLWRNVIIILSSFSEKFYLTFVTKSLHGFKRVTWLVNWTLWVQVRESNKINWRSGPSSSLGSLAHVRTISALSLYYRYFHGVWRY